MDKYPKEIRLITGVIMEVIKKNMGVILNILTLITCICTIAFAWGKMDTKINNTENRQAKIESAVICTDASIRDIFFKLGVLEGKIDNLNRR